MRSGRVGERDKALWPPDRFWLRLLPESPPPSSVWIASAPSTAGGRRDEDPDEGRSRLVGVEHELALLRCAFEYRETLNLKAPWNNREPKGAFVLHILVYEKPSQREL